MYSICVYIMCISCGYMSTDLVDIRPADDAGGNGRVPRGEGQDHGECGRYCRLHGMYALH